MGEDVAHWVGVLERFEASLDEMAEVPVACLAASESRELFERQGRGRSRLDAMMCRSLAEPDWTLLDPVRNQKQAAEVLAADRSTASGPVVKDMTLGRWLTGYGGFSDAWVDGRLSTQHVHALRRCHNRRTREYLAEAQDYLVRAAVDCDWLGFQTALHRWVLSCDPDGEEPREQAQSRSCRVTRQHDGTWDGRFHLDPVAGHALSVALGREEQALWKADEADDTSTRTATQRRADALMNLITRGAAGKNGGGSGPLVHIVFSERVAADTAARLAAASADDHTVADLPGRLPLDDSPDGRSELIDGTPIHPHHALAITTVATLRRIVFSTKGEILDLGRAVRNYPTRLKHALLIKAGGHCGIPGCTCPLAWLQADHVKPWALEGRTSLANGQILCDPHNKQKRDRYPQRREEPPEGDEPPEGEEP